MSEVEPEGEGEGAAGDSTGKAPVAFPPLQPETVPVVKVERRPKVEPSLPVRV